MLPDFCGDNIPNDLKYIPEMYHILNFSFHRYVQYFKFFITFLLLTVYQKLDKQIFNQLFTRNETNQ